MATETHTTPPPVLDREALRALRDAMLSQIAEDTARLDRLALRIVGGRT